jgi:hypothetical protein
VLISLVPLAVSSGRTNALAAVALVAITVVLDPGVQRWSNRVRATVAVTVAGLLTWGIWAERFRTGEDSAYRGRFNETALRFLETADLVAGSGPNTYVSAVGPTDAMAAAGWIVHNHYLLAAVELGLLGAFLLVVPMLLTLARALRARRDPDVGGTTARAFLASMPGILLITMTGWGMMSGMLAPWFFVTGFIWARMGANNGHVQAHTRQTSVASAARD